MMMKIKKKKVIAWIKKNKGFSLVYGLYILGFILDLTTTLMNYKLISLLETNPLYGLFGGLWPVVLANVFILYILFRWYNNYNTRKEHKMTFWMLNLMIFIIILRLLASYNAMQWYENPPSAEEIQVLSQVTVEQKTQNYLRFVGGLIFPLLFAQLVFLCWHWDHLPKRKKKEKK